MRIVCCYAGARPDSLPDGTEMVNTAGDDFAYWRELRSRWTGRSGLLVIEHDIEVHDLVLRSLAECTEPWCSFPYLDGAGGYLETQALGCTRFSAALQRRVRFPAPARWEAVGGRIAQALADGLGMRPCVHEPPVAHRGRLP